MEPIRCKMISSNLYLAGFLMLWRHNTFFVQMLCFYSALTAVLFVYHVLASLHYNVFGESQS